MIVRIWHGWTLHKNADIYQNLLETEIFKSIVEKKILGFRGIQLLRQTLETEEEFITLMWFETIESIKQFAGENYTKAVVPDKARKLLNRFDENSQHYEIKATQAPCCQK